MKNPPKPPHIIEVDTLILGGGVAGIAAAQELESKNEGHSYLLLEAKGHLGGRAHTDGDGNDLGCAWLHSETDGLTTTENPGRHLAKFLKFELEPENETAVIYYNGVKVEDAEFRQIVEKAYKKLENAAWETSDRSVLDVLSPEPGSLEEQIYIAEFGGAESNLDLHEVSVKDFMGIYSRTCGSLVPRGLGNLFQAYASSIPEHKIKLNTEVTKVHWAKYRGGSVIMTAADGTEYHAKNAIITLPIGVLQEKIKEPEFPLSDDLTEDEVAQKLTPFFSPALPAEKQFAINGLQMGLMNKIIIPLKSSQFFDNQQIEPTTHLHVYDTWEGKSEAKFYVANPLGKPQFTMLVGGSAAKELEEKDPKAAIQYALDGLIQAYGEEVYKREILPQIDFDKAKVTEWGKDEYARGAYTGSGIGKSAARRFISKPTGNLFWAGEACWQNGWESHVTGAFFSGQQAARKAYYQVHTPGWRKARQSEAKPPADSLLLAR